VFLAGSGSIGVWLGRGGESDGVAERFELSDVVAGAAFGVDAAGVVVGAEVVVAQARVGQELPDDHQDRACDRDEGLEFAAAFDDAPVSFAQEGVGFAGGGVAEDDPEIPPIRRATCGSPRSMCQS